MLTETPTLTDFINTSNAIFAEARSRTSTIPENTVQVWPGGASFSSIMAALNSITNASESNQYQVAVGAGTFQENIVMKDYVYVIGSGEGVTWIQADGQTNFAGGAVNSAGNCGIADLTINCWGITGGLCPIGIKIVSSGNFHISGVVVLADDNKINGCSVRGVTNYNGSSTGTVIFGQSAACANAFEPNSNARAIEVSGAGFNLLIDDGNQISGSGYNACGIIASAHAAVTIDAATEVAGATYAIDNSDLTATITVNNCFIVGPVSSGVTINSTSNIQLPTSN